jgi:hypothetical protein
MSTEPTFRRLDSIRLKRKAGSWLVQPNPANRAELAADYRIEAFDINIAKRTARCPGGYASTQCSRLAQAKAQKVTFCFEWSYHCRNCPLRSALYRRAPVCECPAPWGVG